MDSAQFVVGCGKWEEDGMRKQHVLSTEDADQWRKFLPADACVMGSVEYLWIMEQQTGCSARLFVVETEGSVIAYPFLVRPIDGLPFATSNFAAQGDTFTPEYTGPLCIPNGSLRDPGKIAFAERFAHYCRQNNIVAEFAHLSPWHDSSYLLDPACVIADREVVHVDLTLGETEIWTKSLTSDTRRQTRQAEKAGVRVRWAESLDDVREFHRLHADTMERREALDRYRIPLEYFVAVFETMPKNAFIALAEYQNRVVAGGLYFYGASDVYWHLSAVDMEFSRLRPVNKFVWETILWAMGEGKQRMLLGGGHEANDGVFHFKAGFSPLRGQFCTYRRIHDEYAYKALTDAWSAFYGTDSSKAGFFPAYRSPSPPSVREEETFAFLADRTGN
jgi:hypothetical protein